MGISDSYLLHLVAIMEPQAIYHPRLPAPFPSNTQEVPGGPTPVSTFPPASVTPGVVRSFDSSGLPVPSGSPSKYLVDLQA
jgi:hypothetical protein